MFERPNEPKEMPGLKFYINLHPMGRASWIQGKMRFDGLFVFPELVLKGEHRIFMQYDAPDSAKVLVFNETGELLGPSNPKECEETGIYNYQLGSFAKVVQIQGTGLVTIMDFSIKVMKRGARIKPKRVFLGNMNKMKNGKAAIFSALGDLAGKIAEGCCSVINGRKGISPRGVYSMAINQCSKETA